MATVSAMDIPRITPRQAAARLAGGAEVIFVDSRAEAVWQRAGLQIPGSIRVPPDRLQRIPALPDGVIAIAYCT